MVYTVGTGCKAMNKAGAFKPYRQVCRNVSRKSGRRRQILWYSERGMRGRSVLGTVLLMGSGVSDWSLFIARWIDSKYLMHHFLT